MKTIKDEDFALVSGGGVDSATIASIGAGIGASRAIQAAGSLGALGTAGTAVVGAGAAGLFASFTVGRNIGTALYNNNHIVRGTAAEIMDRIGPSITRILNSVGFGAGGFTKPIDVDSE